MIYIHLTFFGYTAFETVVSPFKVMCSTLNEIKHQIFVKWQNSNNFHRNSNFVQHFKNKLFVKYWDCLLCCRSSLTAPSYPASAPRRCRSLECCSTCWQYTGWASSADPTKHNPHNMSNAVPLVAHSRLTFAHLPQTLCVSLLSLVQNYRYLDVPYTAQGAPREQVIHMADESNWCTFFVFFLPQVSPCQLQINITA